jgi:hypothetical protein
MDKMEKCRKTSRMIPERSLTRLAAVWSHRVVLRQFSRLDTSLPVEKLPGGHGQRLRMNAARSLFPLKYEINVILIESFMSLFHDYVE